MRFSIHPTMHLDVVELRSQLTPDGPIKTHMICSNAEALDTIKMPPEATLVTNGDCRQAIASDPALTEKFPKISPTEDLFANVSRLTGFSLFPRTVGVAMALQIAAAGTDEIDVRVVGPILGMEAGILASLKKEYPRLRVVDDVQAMKESLAATTPAVEENATTAGEVVQETQKAPENQASVVDDIATENTQADESAEPAAANTAAEQPAPPG